MIVMRLNDKSSSSSLIFEAPAKSQGPIYGILLLFKLRYCRLSSVEKLRSTMPVIEFSAKFKV